MTSEYEIKIKKNNNGWYIVVTVTRKYSNEQPSLYLHQDGEWRAMAVQELNGKREATGYFTTQELAQEALDAFNNAQDELIAAIPLSTENHYMFGFNYNGGTPDDVVVETPSYIDDDDLTFHFLIGYKSLVESVKRRKIVAVGSELGDVSVCGWSGKYTILNPWLFRLLQLSGAVEVEKK
jgi:hypothetical protein